MQRILVCGSEGSLMSSVVNHLPENDYVYGVDNLMRYGRRSDRISRPYIFENVDLTNSTHVDWLFEKAKPDVVIQGAARIYGVGGFNAYCADILSEDVTIHRNVLRHAVKYGTKRVVYISSSMVYETVHDEEEEYVVDHCVTPYTDYGLSKLMGERLSKAYQKQYGLEYTIWRPFNIITPFEKADVELGYSHVFADFINNIVVNKLNPLPIIGDGEQIRCFTWITDVASMIARELSSVETLNATYNLGNPEPVTMKALANLIYKKAGDLGLIDASKPLEFETAKAYAHDVRVRIPDVRLAESVLGWKPTKKVADSVEECLNLF
jgi:nucleoside-diphosphate-sugar epimerase